MKGAYPISNARLASGESSVCAKVDIWSRMPTHILRPIGLVVMANLKHDQLNIAVITSFQPTFSLDFR